MNLNCFNRLIFEFDIDVKIPWFTKKNVFVYHKGKLYTNLNFISIKTNKNRESQKIWGSKLYLSIS